MWITVTVLFIAVIVFVWNKIPVGIVAIGVALSLYFTGVLELNQAHQSCGGRSSPPATSSMRSR
ncbi:hypothetical protein SAMN05216410_0293 [Sanguibacter gelidistatuariae]|uniref:Uncharacterized protein n=1 Tax=Sanguibacter gelidistatuariae TaxID=1814289 RepID=A0A1G6GMJ4_9MICO|nr:hypothetical protein SAMN05216410_0293 [Sanguibacter gelidistatuariae]